MADRVHHRDDVIGKIPRQPKQARLLDQHGWKQLHDARLHGAGPQRIVEWHWRFARTNPFDVGFEQALADEAADHVSETGISMLAS